MTGLIVDVTCEFAPGEFCRLMSFKSLLLALSALFLADGDK